MQLGMIGLGRMGGNMVRRLMRHGHECVVFDRSPAAVAAFVAEGAVGGADLGDLVGRLRPPRVVWIMVPAGAPTESTVEALRGLCSPGDTVIDGGNSFYKDDVRRAADSAAAGLHYLDVGTSGGVWGLERGYCLMVGGDAGAVERLAPIFQALAPGRGDIAESPGREGKGTRAAQGYLHCGPPGAGHFVKMIHNGIEYGLMQAYAEGFDILKSAPAYDFDLADVAELWRRGSVVSSWLLDLAAAALARSPRLDEFTGSVPDSGEGRWTIQTAIEQAVPADVLSASLYARFRSRQEHTFAEKLLSAMRQGFGGHGEEQPKAKP